jgi:magnesium-transporting ATPase (P-type)
MLVPPRNIKTDKLMTLPLMLYAYLQAGLFVFAGCFFTYFLTFQAHGISAKDLFYMHGYYFNVPQDSASGGLGYTFVNSQGRQYTPDDQNYIMQEVWSSWYLQIVLGQAIHLFPARTINQSIFTHGLFSNHYANYALVIAVCLGTAITYCPGFQTANQGLNPTGGGLMHLWACLWLFGALWGWTELRKWYSRCNPNSWINKKLLEY